MPSVRIICETAFHGKVEVEEEYPFVNAAGTSDVPELLSLLDTAVAKVRRAYSEDPK